MDAIDQKNNASQYAPFEPICTPNLIQEEPDFPYSFHPEPFYPLNSPSSSESHAVQDSADAMEQKHRHKLEWIHAIRTSLFPILFSIIVVFILIRILFMIHDADHLLTFLQTILGLFGASAGGYAYAQTRLPSHGKKAYFEPPEIDSTAYVTNELQPTIEPRENKIP